MSDVLSGLRVLVVEDEILVAWMLGDMLAELGCVVVGPAARVNQALAMVEAETIDAAVIDLNLNGQRSYPVADALAVRGVPFVISTGYQADRLQDGYETVPLLQKPFRGSDLGAMLRNLLTPIKPLLAA